MLIALLWLPLRPTALWAWPVDKTMFSVEGGFTTWVPAGQTARADLGGYVHLGVGVSRQRWDGQFSLRVDIDAETDVSRTSLCSVGMIMGGAEFGLHLGDRARLAFEALGGVYIFHENDEGCVNFVYVAGILLADVGPEVILYQTRAGRQLYWTARLGVGGIFSDPHPMPYSVWLNFTTGVGFRF